uniref:Phosphopantothenoylcysteine synthetase n=1 Tax=Salmo trutta TaxID=8032 RepID=A0A674AV75_SALTR
CQKVWTLMAQGEFACPVEEVKGQMAAFAEQRHQSPLESFTLHFLDNFSSGQHGASSAEYLLESGNAVIFLHRHRSLYPFTRLYSGINLLDSLLLDNREEGSGCGQVMVNQQALPNICKVLMCYQVVKEAGLLLPVEFSTLSEYLHLKAAAQALSPIGRFKKWVQGSEMLEHKIQSSNGPLQTFGISFKLETDPSILLDRARQALNNSAGTEQAVVANVLDTRQGYVVVETPYTQAELVLTDEEASRDVEIEDSIVSNLTRAHSQFITQQDYPAEVFSLVAMETSLKTENVMQQKQVTTGQIHGGPSPFDLFAS